MRVVAVQQIQDEPEAPVDGKPLARPQAVQTPHLWVVAILQPMRNRVDDMTPPPPA